MGYAAFERARGCLKEARGVFRRCYARSVQFAAGGDAAEALCGAWLAFERECGSAEDYFQADTKARGHADTADPALMSHLPSDART